MEGDTQNSSNEVNLTKKKNKEIKKINRKNTIIKLLIQKLEGQPLKPKENNVFKQV